MSQKFCEDVFGGFSAEEIEVLRQNIGEVRKALKMIATKSNVVEPKPLRRLYEGERIVISRTDGSETIAQASDIFTGGIDPDFINWDFDHPSESTEEVEVAVHEMAESAIFAGMFAFLSSDLDSLVLTQHQVKSFCREHRDKLHPQGWATFFLLKNGEEYFVARVRARDRGRLRVRVYRFGNAYVWRADYRRDRVVVPQLSSL